MLNADHPVVKRLLEKGYEEPNIVCKVCRGSISGGEYFGSCNGQYVCCDCLDDEFRELSIPEKIECLGMEVEMM